MHLPWLGRKERIWAFFATWIEEEEEGPTLPFGWSCSHRSWSASSVVCSSERKTRACTACSLRDVKSESFKSADDFCWCLRQEHHRPFCIGTATCSWLCEVVILDQPITPRKAQTWNFFAWKRTQSCELREIPTSSAMKEYCKVF